MKAIEVTDLKKKFYDKRKQEIVSAVKGISLSADAGEIFGFLGPNGVRYKLKLIYTT